jgi:hypothetical protein
LSDARNHWRISRMFLVIFWIVVLSGSLFLVVVIWNFFLGFSPQRLTSTDWSGYVVVSDYVNPEPLITGVNGSWVVPNVVGSSGDRFSAAWIGIGGQVDASLIQVGTEHDCSGGEAAYSAWYELLPDLSVPITTMTINPGDKIAASITLLNSTTNRWLVEITDITTGALFNQVFFYNSSRLSAEWIVERPLVNRSLSILADFGSITFTNTVATNNATVMSISKFDFAQVTMYDRRNNQLVSVSSLAPDGESFTVKYADSSPMANQLGMLFKNVSAVSPQTLALKWKTIKSELT